MIGRRKREKIRLAKCARETGIVAFIEKMAAAPTPPVYSGHVFLRLFTYRLSAWRLRHAVALTAILNLQSIETIECTHLTLSLGSRARLRFSPDFGLCKIKCQFRTFRRLINKQPKYNQVDIGYYRKNFCDETIKLLLPLQRFSENLC